MFGRPCFNCPPPSDVNHSNQPIEIRMPFLNQVWGSGDVVQGITQAMGIQPCEPCEERKRRMNQAVVFRPWDA